MTEDYIQRFGGIGRLYGTAAMGKLAAAHVAVVGVGGVGSWIIEALARSGIGALTLIDMDDVCITNTNRQLPAVNDTVGRPKVAVLAERVAAINPECRLTQTIEFLTESNADRLLEGGYDLVIDAVDRMTIKALIIGKCHERGIPVLTSGAAGGRRDPTQVRIADLGIAGADPLLQQVRRKLRRDHGFANSTDGKSLSMGVTAVFSMEKAVYPQSDGTCGVEPESSADKGLRLDCAASFGAATHVTGAFGFALAAEAVRCLTTA